MKEKGRNPVGLYTIGIVGLFLAGFFLLVVFGAKSYSGAASLQNDHMEIRALSAYIVTSVRESDRQGAVEVREGLEGPVLVIADGDTGYAKRIYAYQGDLVEDFAKTEAELMPDQAQVIAHSDVFEVERPAADRLLVTTDEGRTIITLRSEGSEGP